MRTKGQASWRVWAGDAEPGGHSSAPGGGVCARLGLRICEGKGGCGTWLGPPSWALSLPEPAALLSGAPRRSTTRHCLCSQDPSQWGTVDPGGYPGGKGANCREMGDHCSEGASRIPALCFTREGAIPEPWEVCLNPQSLSELRGQSPALGGRPEPGVFRLRG